MTGSSAIAGREPPAVEADNPEEQRQGFTVELANFSGPFDLLLGLIGKRKLDITDIALAEVTDEFISYTRALQDQADLAEISHFLLVAATLLDLKTARLLPRGEVDDELDLELLEARDLLFARLLQYRAYKAVSAEFAERMKAAAVRIPRAVGLEPEFTSVLPPLEMSATPAILAALYATVLQRDHTPPTVDIDHVHLTTVSVAEQRALLLTRLGTSGAEFQELIADADNTLVIVARFLALLELYKVGLCDFEQATPLGELHISPQVEAISALAGAEPSGHEGNDGGQAAADIDITGAEFDEFD